MLTDRQAKQLDALSTIVRVARGAFQTQQIIIAGGAPRDILSRVPVKDIDLFIDVESVLSHEVSVSALSKLFTEKCRTFASHLGYPKAELKFNEDKGYGVDVCDLVYDTGAPIQIVGLHNVDPIEDVHNYDFGLSQTFVGETGVFMTPAAALDRQNKTITYMDNAVDASAFLRSVKRYRRLKEKYFGPWTFINCEKLENYNETAL